MRRELQNFWRLIFYRLKKYYECLEQGAVGMAAPFAQHLNRQKLRLLFSDIGFQGALVNQGGRNAFPGNAEACGVGGDSNGVA